MAARYRQVIYVDLIDGSSLGGYVGGDLGDGDSYWSTAEPQLRSATGWAVENTVRVRDNGDLVVAADGSLPVTFAAGTWTGVRYEIAPRRS